MRTAVLVGSVVEGDRLPVRRWDRCSASADSVGVRNRLYPGPRARNFTRASAWPTFGSKDRGSRPYVRARDAFDAARAPTSFRAPTGRSRPCGAAKMIAVTNMVPSNLRTDLLLIGPPLCLHRHVPTVIRPPGRVAGPSGQGEVVPASTGLG